MRKGLIASMAVWIVCAFWMNVPTGCANMVPPSGGPRDSLPPFLVKAEPKDSSVSFRGKAITFTFDEEVDVKDQQNILYTPTLEAIPEVTAKGRTVTVKFGNRDTLEPNTTYVINFGNSIVDYTEGNPVSNFVYTFSTGPYLDSLEIAGQVLLAENNTVDSTLIVALYRDLRDSAVFNYSPQYITKTDRNGNFRFRNLPADTFAIYAIGGQGNIRRYTNPAQQTFAFSNTPVIAGQADSVLLFAYRESSATTGRSQPNIGKIANDDRRLRFSPATSAQQDLLNDYIINFPVPLKNFDSSKLHLATDSAFTAAGFLAVLDTSQKELRIKTQWKENTSYHLILEKDFATDTAGRQLLKTDTLSFVTKKPGDYGSLSLRIRNLDISQNPLIQFVQNNQVVFSAPIKSGVFTQTLFAPGEYGLRIVYDANNNGKWDPGHFFGEKRQPEKVLVIGQTITVKANWDNEFERAL